MDSSSRPSDITPTQERKGEAMSNGNNAVTPMSELIKEYWLFKGQTLFLPVDGLMVSVKILDVRRRWNTLDAKVSPTTGNGEVWVEAKRFRHIV